MIIKHMAIINRTPRWVLQTAVRVFTFCRGIYPIRSNLFLPGWNLRTLPYNKGDECPGGFFLFLCFFSQ